MYDYELLYYSKDVKESFLHPWLVQCFFNEAPLDGLQPGPWQFHGPLGVP